MLEFSFKAFDTVPHNLLLHMIEHQGISNQTQNWISVFSSEQKRQVIIKEKSKVAVVTSRAPQDSALWPLLFWLFINGMPNCIENDSTIGLFADDAVIYREINYETDLIKLQDLEV